MRANFRILRTSRHAAKLQNRLAAYPRSRNLSKQCNADKLVLFWGLLGLSGHHWPPRSDISSGTKSTAHSNHSLTASNGTQESSSIALNYATQSSSPPIQCSELVLQITRSNYPWIYLKSPTKARKAILSFPIYPSKESESSFASQ
jgi:hypothetical protein